jgi:peptidyl-prolyl cis-trans isomerase A (cyclophilin A)
VKRLFSSSARSSRLRSKPAVEQLESRKLFAAPHVTSIISDNRGEVLITLDQAVVASTVSGRSVQMHTAGADGLFGTADDVKVQARVRWSGGNKRITILTDQLPFNTTYSIKVSAKLVKTSDGTKLDGEFNGPGVRSGDDVAAGDLLFVSKRDKGTAPVARVTTSLGAISVQMDPTHAPLTVANFFAYANSAAWDGTFIHRNAKFSDNSPFVIQGGGFKVKADNTLDFVGENAAVTNEPGVSNTRGTIAMAKKSGDPNSATNQWFFNEQDNGGPSTPAQLDTQNGGFTVFGHITNASGLAVMDSIGALTNKDLRTNGDSTPATDPTVAMDDTPLINPSATKETLNPSADLVVIRRVAVINKVVAFVVG